MNLFVACNGTVIAIRPEDGTELWRTPLGYNEVTLAMAGKSVQFVTRTEQQPQPSPYTPPYTPR